MNFIPWALRLGRTYWREAIGGVLLVALAVTALLLHAARSERDAAIAGRAADRAAYVAAQETARSNALAAAAKKDAENAKKADNADARYADLSVQYRAISLRYAAAQSVAGRTNLPAAPKGTESANGPGGLAVVPSGNILIPQADALICADNTARLEAAREWALSLNESNQP